MGKSGEFLQQKRQPIEKQTISVYSRTQSRVAHSIINTDQLSPNLTDNQPITPHQLLL